MSGSLGTDGAAGQARDLVFVSYSHRDAEWVQRFTVLLSPLLRTKRLRLWADTDIRAGDRWHPDIMAAITRSAVALVLVSKHSLASRFIMDRELPALIAQRVRLAPVLVGSCLWQYVPELADVRWLHDPGQHSALNLIENPGEQDRRLTAICDRLITLAPIAAFKDARIDQRPIAGATPVAEVPPGATPGRLFGVPALPPGYVARDELGSLIDMVSSSSGAVGLVGQAPTVGLHGQGGIGKSVLAAAVARDEDVRGRFPDGLFWVTLGENADPLAAQLDLLARLGDREAAPRTRMEAAQRLTSMLRDHRVLLVVDDVWSDAAALAFRVTGPRGRVLYTTRDAAILTACAATPHRVGVLSAAQARAVAATPTPAPTPPSPATPTRCTRWPGHPTAPTSPPPATTGTSESGTPTPAPTPPSPATPTGSTRWPGHPPRLRQLQREHRNLEPKHRHPHHPRPHQLGERAGLVTRRHPPRLRQLRRHRYCA